MYALWMGVQYWKGEQEARHERINQLLSTIVGMRSVTQYWVMLGPREDICDILDI